MVQPRTGNGTVQIALRLPVELRDAIKEKAMANGRSINSEIVDRLEFSLDVDGPKLDPEQEALVRKIVSQLVRKEREGS